MKQLTRFSVERPLALLMLILALVIMGWRGYSALKVDRYPSVNFPFVAVITTWPGASPADVEDQIIKPIEDAVAGISGVDKINSTARESVASTQIQFLENVDSNQAASDVERAVARIKATLPSDANEPTIVKADLQALPIMNITLSGSQSLEELYRAANDDIKPRLLAVPGVASVDITGGLEKEIRVQADPMRMAAYEMSLPKISAALQSENVDVPAGAVTAGSSRTSVRSLGRFSNLEDIQNLVITSVPKRVQMKDLAAVTEGHKDIEVITRLNNKETVGLSITKASDANAVETADNVRKALAIMKSVVPQGTELTIVSDDTEFTRASVNSVQTDLILAVIITGAVLLLFLHMFRSTAIVLLAVPTSLISTFLVMYALGYSLNMLTLLALALTVGILVDDSIVVLENIFRHLEMGEAPKEAAMNGRAEIGMAALAITFCDVVIYLPVAFMSGIVGQFFREYGITIAVATLFSLFISFTLTPMLASRWLTQGEEHPGGLWGKFVTLWETTYTGLANLYARSLDWSLSHRPLIIAVAVVALFAAFAFIPLRLLGVEFMPTEDDNRFTANVLMPAGTSLQATDQATRQLEEIVFALPETDKVLTQVGSKGGSFFGGSGAGASGSTVTVILADKKARNRSVFQIVDEVRQKVKSIPEANVQLSTSSFMGGGMGAALQVQVQGPDMNTLIDLSKQVEEVMKQVPGVADVRNVEAERSPEFQARLNRDRMNDLGISSAEVGMTLRTAIAGAQASTYKREGQSDLDITLVTNEQTRNNTSELARLPLKFSKTGAPITLGQVASIEQADGPAQIKRYNRQRTLTITGSVVGRSSGDVSRDINDAVAKKLQLPPGYRVAQVGQAEQQQSSFGSLLSALFLSILLIYMLMVALYESVVQPLAIMFSLPVAMVGAFTGLFITGNTLNIFSLLGIIMLMGLVTKNAILLVDFTDILRERGYPRHQALVEAGRLRLRPILMTTAAMVCAMIPFVLKLEAGAESRAPLAAAVMGGLISSTMLTLVLVPTVYTYLDSIETLVRVKIMRQAPRFVEKDQKKPAAPGEKVAPQSDQAARGEAHA